MSINYTTDALVDLIKLNISSPTVQPRYTTDNFIQFLNQEMNNNIVPAIKKTNQEFFVTEFDIVLENDRIAYTIPSAALGETLRTVSQLNPSDTTEQREIPIRRLTQDEIVSYWNGAAAIQVSGTGSTIYSYYIQGSEIRLYPAPTNMTVPRIIRLRYFRQPNNLVNTNQAGKITAIDYNTNTVTVNNVPTSWANGTRVCAINGYPPFDAKIEGTAIITLSNPTIELADVSKLNIGDWICLEGDSVIPQIPYSCFGTLVQASIVKVLQGIKDTDGLKIAQAILDKLYEQMIITITPRNSGQVPKRTGNGAGLFSINRRSTIRRWWGGN